MQTITNNPITVTPVQDEANHNTTYQVTFDGDKAAKQIPLTYKANGTNDQKVTLDKGLNFTNGRNTTASVAADGVVKYDVNKDLVDINSISNTTNGPKWNLVLTPLTSLMALSTWVTKTSLTLNLVAM